MGNCLVRAGASCEEDKTEAKPLVISTMDDQAILNGDNCCKKRKKVRFNVESDNAVEAAIETAIMRPPRMKKGVRVKVVLTQTELKQILNRATIYNHHLPSPPASFVDQISGQVVVKCRSRRSSVMCKSRCSTWNPALHTIPEY